MFRSCPPWRRCRDIPTLARSFLPPPVALSVGSKPSGPKGGRKMGVTQGWLQKTVLIKALMAAPCCPVHKTRSLPHAKVPLNKRLNFRVPSPFPADRLGNQEKWRSGGRRGCLSCCFGHLGSMCCNKQSSSHLHPYFLSEIQSFLVVVDLLGLDGAAVEESALGLFEEDESDGWGCALPGQPWPLDGTCLQFSLSVTRPADL